MEGTTSAEDNKDDIHLLTGLVPKLKFFEPFLSDIFRRRCCLPHYPFMFVFPSNESPKQKPENKEPRARPFKRKNIILNANIYRKDQKLLSMREELTIVNVEGTCVKSYQNIPMAWA